MREESFEINLYLYGPSRITMWSEMNFKRDFGVGFQILRLEDFFCNTKGEKNCRKYKFKFP